MVGITKEIEEKAKVYQEMMNELGRQSSNGAIFMYNPYSVLY